MNSPRRHKHAFDLLHVNVVEPLDPKCLEELLDGGHGVAAGQRSTWVVQDEGQAHLLLGGVSSEGGAGPAAGVVGTLHHQGVSLLNIPLFQEHLGLLVLIVILVILENKFSCRYIVSNSANKYTNC